jgi:HEAT repeat protein
LAALPERYRAAVVLCDLEGKTRLEAAKELGCAEGTVASRLARGRALLAKRLARCGLTVVALVVSREIVPAELTAATVRAALLRASVGAAGVVSANVAALVERVVRLMLVAKLRTLTTLVFLLGVTGLGAGWLYYHRATAEQPKVADGVSAQVGKEDLSEQAKLRQELKLLKQDLRGALERVTALEAKLKDREEIRSEVLYRGQPAAYWIKSLQDRDPDYRKQAVKALASIAKVDRAVMPVLAGAMKDDDYDVARLAAVEFGELGKVVVPYLNDALKSRDQQVRKVALQAIRFTLKEGGEALVPTLREILKNGSGDERTEAANALSSLGPIARAAVPDLIVLLKEKNKNDRYTAAYALEKIGPDAKAAVPALIDLLKDEDTSVRGMAIMAVGKIGPGAKEAVPTLIELLKSNVANDSWNAMIALGRIGPDAKAALPALRELRRNLEVMTGDSRKKVKEAIDRIEQKKP